MKRVVRPCVFESNSSTSHSCIIMTDEMYEKWESENLYYYNGNGLWFDKLPADKRPDQTHLYTQDEVLAFYEEIGYPFNLSEAEREYNYTEETLKDKYIREMRDFITYDLWEDEELESDVNFFKTPGGEQIRVMCKYGWDG